MKTYWWKTPKGITTNFGDQLNPYLFKKITGKEPVHFAPSAEYITLLGIGSILGLFMDKLKYCIVWGSGFGRNPSHLKCFLKRQKFTAPKKICAVRGPLTREAFLRFNVACPEIYGDPALLIPRYYSPRIDCKYDIGIIPHYSDYTHEWVKRNSKEDVLIIDVNSPVETVINNLLSCKKIISSSLHGLIMADAYQIPSSWIILSNNLFRQSFKFYDYFNSVGANSEKPIIIKKEDFSVMKIANLAHTHKIKLSLDKLMDVCPLISV